MPIPKDFGVPYEDLELVTPDNITLRCYLLPQRTGLPNLYPEAARVEGEGTLSDDEVCYCFSHVSDSSWAAFL